MSKGSNRRPTDEKKYKDNYDQIFGKSKQPNKEKPNGDTPSNITSS